MIFIATNVGGFYVSYYRIRKRPTNDFRAVSTANQILPDSQRSCFFQRAMFLKISKKDFNVYLVNSPLVSYYSVDNSFVLTQVTQNSFQEVLCLKTSCATLVFNNKLYVFYLDNSLMGVCSDNLTEKHCIVENISSSNHISAFVHNNCIFLLQLTIQFMKST